MCILYSNELLRYLLGFALLIIGNILVRHFYSYLRNKYLIKGADNIPYQRAIALLGYLESFTYASAYYLGHPQFIAVWLGVKAIGRWSPNGPKSFVDLIKELEICENDSPEIKEKKNMEIRERKNAEINLYLIGNLLSIILSVMVAKILKML